MYLYVEVQKEQRNGKMNEIEKEKKINKTFILYLLFI